MTATQILICVITGIVLVLAFHAIDTSQRLHVLESWQTEHNGRIMAIDLEDWDRIKKHVDETE